MDRNSREIIYRQVLFYNSYIPEKCCTNETKNPIYNSVFPGG
jgi:hypothetical protein